MASESFFGLLKQNYPQVVAVFFGTLNALADGMQFGWSAPTVPKLSREDSPIKITENDIMLLEVLYMMFGLVGLPITIILVDRIGRQKSVLAAAATNLIGWVLIGVGDRVEYLIVARCLAGAAADVAFVCSPMYIAEVAHKDIRGFLAGIIYTMVLAGVLLIYAIAPFVSIRIPPLIGGFILITQLIVFPFMPESPYYLLFKNNESAAKKSLQKLRGLDDVDKELEEISAAITRQKLERGRPQDLILIDSNRRALFIMIFLNAVQHMVGLAAILMNFHTILKEAGATYLNSDVSAIIFATVMLVASIFSILVIDKFGRKVLYTISCICSGISLLVIAIFYNLKYSGIDMLATAWIPLVFLMLYAASFKFGIGVIPIVMTAELFPARLKALGMTVADGIYVLFASISIYLYQALYLHCGLHVAFYLFAGVSFAAFIFNVFVLPETKGKTLDEIQMMLKQ